MTPDDLIKHYDGNKAKAAKELYVSWQTVHNWSLRGYIPEAGQRRIEWVTRGKLLSDGTLEAAKKVEAMKHEVAE